MSICHPPRRIGSHVFGFSFLTSLSIHIGGLDGRLRREQRNQPLHKCRVSQHGIVQRRVQQPGENRNLHRSQNLSRARTERSESEDAIAILLHQRLHDSARLGQRSRAQVGVHRNLE